jgi:hypothetical protein
MINMLPGGGGGGGRGGRVGPTGRAKLRPGISRAIFFVIATHHPSLWDGILRHRKMFATHQPSLRDGTLLHRKMFATHESCLLNDTDRNLAEPFHFYTQP